MQSEIFYADVVLAPGKERYEVQAAGVFKIDGEVVEPTFNELKAEAVLSGEPENAITGKYRLRWPDYKVPNARLGYIVKGTPVGAKNVNTFEVAGFAADHIEVRIRRTDGDITDIKAFMVEISTIAL